ncbi:MAG: type I 3-dehydroquinate dehydratase [Deltaproteobacteria bacterium]|nr:type I 3-dehydroquinate dehydratase [Deltaproteobacteria bacterium]
MICLTGSEARLDQVARRIEGNQDCDLFEIRLDLLEHLSAPGDPPGPAGKLIVTCRPARQGGGFNGTERERLLVLSKFLSRWKPGWLDIEFDTPKPMKKEILEQAGKISTKVIVSDHELNGFPRQGLSDALEQLAAENTDAFKFAVTVHDAGDLKDILEYGKSFSSRKEHAVLIGMGPAGLLSRALYDRFGSSWCYLAQSRSMTTASGQMDTDTFKSYGLPLKPGAELYVLMGGPQVMLSPGPAVYNKLFRETGFNGVYLPVITKRPGETLDLLALLGCKGASVTMPLKARCLASTDRVSIEAERSGSLNTLTFESRGSLRGHSTDGLGATAALRTKIRDLKDKKAVVLGTGGTASSIAYALQRAGTAVTILGRDLSRAKTLGHRLGAGAGRLDELSGLNFDILVNATPVGMNREEESLVRDTSLLAGKVVLDVILSPSTRLLRDTIDAGGTPISGVRMWAEQGRLQLEDWGIVNIHGDRLFAEATAFFETMEKQ